MTPFRARLTFLGFVVLTGAISVNALYMQQPLETRSDVTGSVNKPSDTKRVEGRHQNDVGQPPAAAPKGDLQTLGSRVSPDRPAQPSPARPKASGIPPAEATPPSADAAGPMPPDEVIRAIQRELTYRNYAVDRRDGQLDTATRMAILNYQFDAGLSLTGLPSEELLKHILFGPLQNAAEGNRTARIESDRALVASVQRVLSRLGFGNLPETGRLGPRTRKALEDFAAFRDLPRDGHLSPRLLLDLAIVTDEPLRRRPTQSAGDIN